jgi:hypothetical protein
MAVLVILWVLEVACGVLAVPMKRAGQTLPKCLTARPKGESRMVAIEVLEGKVEQL